MGKKQTLIRSVLSDKLARTGDRIELYGTPNRFGGRPVVACIERDATGFVVRTGEREQRTGTADDAIAEVEKTYGVREDWTFAT